MCADIPVTRTSYLREIYASARQGRLPACSFPRMPCGIPLLQLFRLGTVPHGRLRPMGFTILFLLRKNVVSSAKSTILGTGFRALPIRKRSPVPQNLPHEPFGIPFLLMASLGIDSHGFRKIRLLRTMLRLR